MTPVHMGGNNENDRVASPESVSIHLNSAFSCQFELATTDVLEVIALSIAS